MLRRTVAPEEGWGTGGQSRQVDTLVPSAGPDLGDTSTVPASTALAPAAPMGYHPPRDGASRAGRRKPL